MNDDTKTRDTNAAVILDAGQKIAARVETIAGVPCLVNPVDGECEPLTAVLAVADERADKPRRRKGTATLQSIGSFVEHVNRFASDATAIFADAAQRQFIGVLNYHAAGAASDPAWGDHRALYTSPLSPEWTRWGAGAEKAMDQDAFAKFLDKYDRDLAANVGDADGHPYAAPSDLMTLARKIEAFDRKQTKRERTDTGVSLVFTADSGIKSEVAIPRAFAIKIPIFADGTAQAIEVRLRVEQADGAPRFTIQIHDADKVLTAAFAALIKVVTDGTKRPVYVGTPEK